MDVVNFLVGDETVICRPAGYCICHPSGVMVPRVWTDDKAWISYAIDINEGRI
ncbi:hypothetical protein M404DRAFT_1004453 [Pisolithus tinctorius Marx 270]|uniref:Uncharacterized protein n=1 Tax=Pisolithus tinctorius Marx 270 TaxID=870435 RepID=A0A0C3JQF4_PISTI|nr:hypothetical protein M404DRAFT_1004453 [Pisolithus tinctorius Marx 270]